jgi:hypothetical protein
MTEAQIAIVKKALLEIEQERQKNIDSLNKVEPNYSEKYNKAISRLLKDQREKESSSLHLTYRQRIALLIATVLLTALTITACANAEAIKEFVVETIEHFVRLTIPTQENKFTLCEATYIPRGYHLESETFVEKTTSRKYFSNGTYRLTYIQNSTTANFIIDKEYEIIYIDDQKIYQTYNAGTYSLVWVNDFGIFNITYHESISWEEIETMFRSITPIEEAPADPE